MRTIGSLSIAAIVATLAGCGASAEEESFGTTRAQNQPATVGQATTGQPVGGMNDAQDTPGMTDTPSEVLTQEQGSQGRPGQMHGQQGQGMQGQRGQGQGQGMQGQRGQGQQNQGQLAMRKGDEDVRIQDVILRRDRQGTSRLIFFRDDVDCAAVREDPSGDDAFVAMTEVEPGTDGMPDVGQLPAAQWTYRVEREPDTMAGGRGWVTITRVPVDQQTVEGTVAVATEVQDERFELRGPFTATVCEVNATAVPATTERGNRAGQRNQGNRGQDQTGTRQGERQGQSQGQSQGRR